MWIARNKNGTLYLYEYEPDKYSDSFAPRIGQWAKRLNSQDFLEVTWENSPIKVKLTIETPAYKTCYKSPKIIEKC